MTGDRPKEPKEPRGSAKSEAPDHGGRQRASSLRLDEALKRGEDTSGDIDPALVSRLEAWFGPTGPELPAQDEPEQPSGTPEGWHIPKESDEEQWRRARALETAAEGELIGRIEQRALGWGQLVEPLPAMELNLERSLNRFELRDWGIRSAAEHVDRERPDELWDALREQVPQAILRDLHRPVPEVGPVQLEQTKIDLGSTEQLALIKILIRARYKVQMEHLTQAGHDVVETMADLRARLDDEPWAEARPEEPSPWPSAVPEGDLMRWFAPGGGK